MSGFSKLSLKILIVPFRCLPLRVHYFFSGFVCFLVYKVLRYRTTEVVANIAKCFPQKDYSFIKETTRQFYRHFADIIVETIWFGGCRNPERLRRSGIVKIVNPEELVRLDSFSKGGLMTLYTHCGNWELYGGIENYSDESVPFNENNFVVVYKKMSSRLWDDFMKKNRFAPLKDREGFEGYIESKNIVRYAFMHRGEKKFYNINTDQRPYYAGSGNLWVNFMGCRATSMSAGASLAQKLSLPVCYLRMRVASRGHYELEYVTICEDASKLTVQEIMDKFYLLLDEDIKAQPWNYLWTHRRWVVYF